jgi:hypothetical protein
LPCRVKVANIPAMRSPLSRLPARNVSQRIKSGLPSVTLRSFRRCRPRQFGQRLMLTLVILLLHAAAVTTTPAEPRIVLGSHIPRVEHPFVMSHAQWDELFVGISPDGKRLSAQQLSPLVLHAQWPANSVDTSVYWHLKIGVFLLNVRGDGTVSSIGILQRIGHPNMDGATVRAFAHWRFRPNSVKEVRVPAYYTHIN